MSAFLASRSLVRFVFTKLFQSAAVVTLASAGPITGAADAATFNGSIPGSFSVSPTGAATYSIPIEVPPGIGGMTPQLSLNYSSQVGNGLLGVGWTLGGLSAITRCPATLAQDGFIDGVDFDAKDGFCLDGQRLIRVGATAPDCSKEYRTEIDSYARICALSDPNDGGTKFRVETKSGLISEYGGTTDSKIEAVGRTDVLVWAINKTEDTSGNRIETTYAEWPTQGQYYPVEVQYFGSDGRTNSELYRVLLSYEDRPDTGIGYIGGSKVRSLKRLKTITTGIRTYTLDYQTAPNTGQSTLSTISSCSRVFPDVCSDDITLEWTAGDSNWSRNFTSDSTDLGYDSGRQWADFNGDGLADFCRVVGGEANGYYAICTVSTPSGFQNTYRYSMAKAGYEGSRWWVDITGDGKADWCRVSGGGSSFVLQCNPSTGTGFAGMVSLGLGGNPGWEGSRWFADINGDGRADYCRLAGGPTNGYVLQCNLSRGGEFGPIISLDLGANQGNEHSRWLVDVNADGMADYCRIVGDVNGYQLLCNRSTGSGFGDVSSKNIAPGQDNNRWWADINGDGAQDYCRLLGTTDPYQVACDPSTGTGFAPAVTLATSKPGYEATRSWVDINGDGRADFCRLVGVTGNYTIRCTLSNGNEFGEALLSEPLNNMGLDGDRTWADVNGDGRPEYCRRISSSQVSCRGFQEVHDAAVVSVANGSMTSVRVVYSRLSDSDVYTSSGDATYPRLDVQGAMRVVKTSKIDDGIGGVRATAYTYHGLQADLTGRGFLGFRRVVATDLDAGTTIETNYLQDFPYTGLVNNSVVRVNGTQRVSDSANVWEAPVSAGVYKLRNSSTSESTYDLNLPESLLTTVTTTTSGFDAFGNPGQVVVSTTAPGMADVSKTTTNTYGDNPLQWHLGRLVRSTVTIGTETRTSAFEYDPTTGLLTAEIVEPDDPQLMLRTEYEYDRYGNKTRITVRDSGSNGFPIVASTSTTTYDYGQLAADGLYTVTSTNAVGHTESQVINARFGKPIKLTGPNGLSTLWKNDGFGRLIQETRADGSVTTTAYESCIDGCVGLALYKVVTTSTGSAAVSVEYDTLGREVRTQAVDLTGDPIYKKTTYNALGQVASISRPYKTTASHTTDFTYDDLGRVIREVSPDGGIVETAYNGLTTTITRRAENDSYVQSVKREADVEGNLRRVWDEGNRLTEYTYDPFGNLTSVTDPAHNVTTMTYDRRGRKTAMDDPDMGHWEYAYDALGQLRWQRDAKGQVVTMSYDVLGRMVSRSEAEGTSTWTYDQPGSKGIGKLWKVSGPNGYSETYTYDALGRPSQTQQVADGQTFTTANRYDTSGRLDVLTYPSGFRLKHAYASTGYLQEISNADSVTEVFWTAQEMAADGQITSERLGNGLLTTRGIDPASGRLESLTTAPASLGGDVQALQYSYDALGNLTRRQDALQGLDESFQYDSYNRLTHATISGVGTKTWTYDDLGNITAKDGYTDYSYGPAGSVQPHAVKTARGNTYTYDANGNMASGGGRTFTWNSANLPTRIEKGAVIAEFSYGPDRARYKQVSSNGSTTIKTLYVGKLYEQVSANGVVTHKNYIAAAGRVVAIREVVDQQVTMKYLHQDHLGSTDAITDATGQVLERQSFDAFGTRRVTADWRDPIAWISSLYSTRGYTGHEMLDSVGLIHMNGRVYDPELGRFISADPVVKYPEGAQGLNRYSYVDNNPLSRVDPSGYGWLSKAWKSVTNAVKKAFENPIVRVVVAVAAAWFTAGAINGWYMSSFLNSAGGAMAITGSQFASASLTASVLGGAAGGFVAGGILTGSLEGAVKGGITGAMFGGINGVFNNTWNMARVGANSLAGGASSAVNGGRFKDGLRFSLMTSMARVAWEYTRYVTDKLKLLSVEHGGRAAKYNEYGELITDGVRGSAPGVTGAESFLGSNFGMNFEGSAHWYDRYSGIARFVNQVSKMHDYFNSVRYDFSTGFFRPFQSQLLAESFELYSFAGMPVAGVITGMAHTAHIPVYSYALLRNDE